MSAHAEFARELGARLLKQAEEIGQNLARGSAQSFEDYRERVGEVRAYLRAAEMIEEVTKHVEERIRR